MKTKKMTVFYCEFCGRHRLRSVKAHEETCTLNPQRRCKLCGAPAGSIDPIIEKYWKKFIVFEIKECDEEALVSTNQAIYLEPFTWRDVSFDVGGCPICCLAILRQMGLTFYYHDSVHEDFDYKKLVKEWWDEKATEELRKDQEWVNW